MRNYALALVAAVVSLLTFSVDAALVSRLTFDDSANLLKASVGADGIAYSHKLTPESGNGNLYSAASASVLENAHGGALAIPMDAFLAIPHGLTDGTKWCLKMRIFIPTGNLWYSLFTLAQDNDSDGWMFIKNNTSGQFGGGVGGFSYTATTAGAGIFGKWSTVVLSVDSTSSCQLYVNGEYLGASSKTSEYSLNGKNYIFIGADNDHEDNLFYADYIEVYDEAHPAEVFQTGKFTDHLPTGSQTWRGVPSDYAQVEYIRSSSAQLIDTGIIPGPTVAVDFNFGDVVYAQNTALFGQNWNGNNYLFNQQNSKFMFHSSGNDLDTSVLANTDYRCQVDTDGNLYLAHGSIVNTYPGMTLTAATDQKLAIFGCINGNNLSTFTLYGMKIYRNDVLISDLVPVIRVSDEKPGLYDLVEAKFLENTKSAADFTYGEKIKKPKENPTFVSTGAQVYDIKGTGAEYYYWSDTVTPGTITIPEGGATVDVLLVGGGGAGGLCRGGGGGGGGVVYQLSQTLPAGTYTVTVGAGGVPQVMGSGVAYQQGKSPATTCGGDSVISNATTEIIIAHGGGGGGNFTYKSGADVENCKGYDGGSGGGAGGHNEVAIPGGVGIEGEGYDGGAQPSTFGGAGGGGGAGSVGAAATALSSGNGGSGRNITITGENVVYGGGGGGGGFKLPGGAGGAGGGGAGRCDEGLVAAPGTNGLGGGGGGGGCGADNKASNMGGGAGGSGVVILRYSPPSPAATIAAFEVKNANYDNVDFNISVSSLGTGASSATAVVEIADDNQFANIVTNKTKALTEAWIETNYTVDVMPTNITRYARLIVDNGLAASTSEVVAVSQTHAFVLSGCGYEYKNGGLEVSALVSSLAAPSVTIALYLNDAASPSVTTNVTAAGNVVMMLSGLSTAVDIRVELTAYGKSETQNVAAKPGSVQKVVVDPSAHVTGVNAVVVKAGDSVILPAGYTYECLDADRFIAIDGNLVATKDAGILLITQYDAQRVELANVVLIIEPADKAANARTFIWDESAAKAWNNPAGWKQVGVEENEDYPNAATDLVFVPITAAKTLSVSGTNTVQDLYVGYLGLVSIDGFRLQGGSASGNALKIVGVRTEGAERPGRFGILSSTVNEAALTVRLGGNDANHYLALIAESDLDFDFGGPLGTQYGPTSRHRYTKMYCSNTHLEIAEDATVRYINGQNHQTSVDMQGGWYEFCTDFLRGKGTFRMAMAGVFTMWSDHFRAFEGTVVNSIRNNISQASSNRGGNIYSEGYNSPNSKLRLEGFVTTSYSITTSVGTFAQGSSHGYGGSGGFSSNGLPDAGVEFAGGFMNLFNFNKSKSGFWPRVDGDYEVHNFTDTMTVDAGLTVLANNASPSSTQPIDHFCASNIVHRNDGAIYFIDSRTTGDDVTRRSITEVHGMSGYFVGYTGAADLANNVFPIVPWMVTRCGSNVKPDLWWAYTDADSYMCRPGTRTNVTLDEVTDPNRNVYSNGRSLALTADKTINSLSLNNYNKESRLGEGRTLTITSGGLILNENGSSIGTASGGDRNGALSFPNRAYIYPTADGESNPNAIWTPITAPNGIVITMPGYFILGGDQTGIDTNIVINNGTTWLGAKDGSGTIAIDVPVKLVGGNTKLVLTRAGVFENLDFFLETAGGYSPKIELSAGVNETCNKLYVDGETLPHGTYGATGSGAEIIDDVHFSGTGTLTVKYDDLGWPIVKQPVVSLVEEFNASFTVDVVIGTGATDCEVRSIATRVSDGVAATNLVGTLTEDVENFAFAVSNLNDGVAYDVVVWAHNSVPNGAETIHYDMFSDPVRITTVAVDYHPELTVDESNVEASASTAKIPWNLVNKGYGCELVSLKIVYGTATGVYDHEFALDPEVERGANLALLTGLSGNTGYFAKIVAKNDKDGGLEGSTAEFAFTTMPPAAVSGEGNELVRVGGDYVARFTNGGELDVPENVSARILVVGGGGAGGRWQGGGGGGGQVVALDSFALVPGHYTITVGVGGTPTDNSGYKRDYSNGGDSSLMQNDVVIAQAAGGGAGGNYCNTDSVRNGSDGGNGGGASYGDNATKLGSGGMPVKGGFAGGDCGDGKFNVTTGGGGGAGGKGGTGVCLYSVDPGYCNSGNGGDGVMSDITGEAVWYGGGGGGGCYSRDTGFAGCGMATFYCAPGAGGQGGGGQGGGGNYSYGGYKLATAGVDGLGGGGGGGARYNEKTSFDTNHCGMPGGKGTVIVRFVNTDPLPALTAKVVRNDLVGAEVDLSLEFAGAGTAAADVYYALGTDPSALSPVLVASGVASGSTIARVRNDLVAGATYHYSAFASNSVGRSSTVVGSFTAAVVPLAGSGGTVVRQGDYVVHTFSSSGTLTLPSSVEAEILAVGGGGAGGYSRAGGGGAGGFVHRYGERLSAGAYTITVGNGGSPVSTKAGGNGGDSVVAFDSTDIVRAVGGGGGGSADSDSVAYGLPGGSGGGSAKRRPTPANGVDGQGNFGGISAYGDENGGGGGGGAKTRGGDGIYASDYLIKRGGAGGDGLDCGITGEYVCYAGGGGGSFYNKKGDGNWYFSQGGAGGRGGGGTGAGANGSSSSYACYSASAGVDGLGGGGGGGSSGESSSAPRGGAAGGKGVVIVRYFAPESGMLGANPAIDITDVVANEDGSATVSWKVVSAGTGCTSVRVLARYGTSTNKINRTVTLASESVGNGSAVIRALKPGADYYITLEARNELDRKSASALAFVAMPKLTDYATTRFGGHEGLLQAYFDGSDCDWSSDMIASDTLRREYGTAMTTINGVPGKSGTWQYVSPIDSFVSSWAAMRTFAYSGYIYLTAGTTMRFCLPCDDYALVKINGEVVARTYNSCYCGIGYYYAKRTGWYPIEARAGNTRAGAGMNVDNGDIRNIGLGYGACIAGVKDSYWGWYSLMDDGKLGLLRTGPEGRGFDAVFVSDSAGVFKTRLTTSASSAAADSLYVCYGATAAGEDSAKWDHCLKVSDLAATAESFDYSLELTDDLPFVRFFTLDSSGHLAWSQTFVRDVFDLPKIGEVHIAENNGDQIVFAGSTEEPVSTDTVLKLHYGTDRLDPDGYNVMETRPNADGTFSVTVDGLPLSTRYYYYWTIEKNGVVQESTGGEPNVVTGSSAQYTVWYDTRDQRYFRLHVEVSSLGVGGRDELVLMIRKYSRKNDYPAYTAVDSTIIDRCGEYVLEWDAKDVAKFQDVFNYRLNVKNGAGASSYEQNSDGTFIFEDRLTYTWTGGGATDAWNDPANWSESTGNPDGYGYPAFMSDVVFPAGCDATVTLTEPELDLHSIVFEPGAAGGVTRVKMKGPNAIYISRRRYGDFTSDGYLNFGDYVALTLDGAKLVTGENAGSIELGKNNALTLSNGAGMSTLGNFTARGAATAITLEGGSVLASYLNMQFGGNGSRVILDDSEIMVHHAEYRVYMNENNADDVRWIIKGRNPRISMARINTASSKPLPVDLVVPVGGFATAPFRKFNQTRQTNELPCDKNTYQPMVLTVDPSSPALADNRTVTMPIFDCIDTLAKSEFTLTASTGVEWSWSNPYAKSADTLLSLEIEGQGPSAVMPDELQTPTERKYGPYTIYTYSDPTRCGVFSVDSATTVDVLMVAGGGAGGWSYPEDKEYATGGGGAGGLKEIRGLAIGAGDYLVNVGRGGDNRSWDRFQRPIGENGYDTVVFGYRLYGGGGGASLSRDWNASCGQYGGSGGGACNGNTTLGKARVAGEGYAGGSGVTDNYGAGGGGAGGVGANGKSTNSHGVNPANGDGGPGVTSDISGETREYAGGGGAGANSRSCFGGSATHGGGRGGERGSNSAGSDGLDGTGAGGGGAAWDRERGYMDYYSPWACWGQIYGGKGGDGVVIIRKRTETSTAVPYVAFRKATSARDGATIEWEYLEAGNGGSETGTTFKFFFGEAAGVYSVTNTVTSGIGYGVKSNVFGALRPGTTYYGTIVAYNSNNVKSPAALAEFSFTTLGESITPVSLAGLIQGSSNVLRDRSFDIAAAADARREYGAVMAERRGDYTSPIDGVVSYWTRKKTIGYTGYMYMVAGVPYSFAANFNYVGYMKVNNTVIIDRDSDNQCSYAGNAFTPDTDGWYPIEIRVGTHDSVSWGPYNNFYYGAAWTTNENHCTSGAWEWIDTTGWERFMDPGDGSLLRTAPPKARELTLEGAIWNADKTELTAVVSSVKDGVTSLEVIACYGTSYGGDSLANWTTKAVGTISADAEMLSATLTSVPVKGYLRFAAYLLDANGNRTGEMVWSDSLYLTDLNATAGDLPSIAVGAPTPEGASAVFPVTVLTPGAGAAGCSILVSYGKTDSFGSFQTIGRDLVAGYYGLELVSLDPDTEYYARVRASNESGATDWSETFVFTTASLDEAPAKPVPGIYQSYVGTSWDANFDIMAQSNLAIADGTLAAHTNDGASWNVTLASGVPTTSSWVNNRTFGYRGYIHLRDKEYVFGAMMDDRVSIAIDGKVLIDQSGQTPMTVTYRPKNGDGWYLLEMRVGNGGGGAGPYAGFIGAGWNDEGYMTVDDSEHWHKFIDPGDGSLLSLVRTVRSVDVASYYIEGDSLVASLFFGDDFKEQDIPLYVAYGPTYGGDDEASWAHVQKIGTFGKDDTGTTYIGLSDLGGSVRYVRFFFKQTGVRGWSSTVVLGDLTKPALDHSSFTVEEEWRGDAVVASARLVYTAGTQVTVLADVSRSGAFDDVETWTAVYDPTSRMYVATIHDDDVDSPRYVIPGRAVSVRFRAVGANGKSDMTSVKTVVTSASSEWKNSLTLSSNHSTITAKATLKTFGAHRNADDGTIVKVYAGLEPDDLHDTGVSAVMTDSGDVTVSFEAEKFGQATFVCLLFTNECLTTGWSGWTPLAQITPVDRSAYYWTGLGGDGLWSNPENWTNSYAVSAGYPKSETVSVVFGDGVKGVCYLDASYTIGNLYLSGNGADITFKSVNDQLKNGSLKAAVNGSSANSRWVIDGCTLWSYSSQNWGWGSSSTTQTNNQLIVRNQGTFKVEYRMYYCGDDNYLEVSGGSSFYINNTDHHLYLGGNRTKFVVDDSSFVNRSYLLFSRNYPSDTETLVIAGENPIVKPRETLVIDRQCDVNIVFEPPRGGFLSAPIVPYGTGESRLEDLFSGTEANSHWILSFSKSSRAFSTFTPTEIVLIDWRNTKGKTIDTSKVVFADTDDGFNVEWIWTYGSGASETPSGKPTGLKARVWSSPSKSGFKMIFRP